MYMLLCIIAFMRHCSAPVDLSVSCFGSHRVPSSCSPVVLPVQFGMTAFPSAALSGPRAGTPLVTGDGWGAPQTAPAGSPPPGWVRTWTGHPSPRPRHRRDRSTTPVTSSRPKAPSGGATGPLPRASSPLSTVGPRPPVPPRLPALSLHPWPPSHSR